MQSTVAILFCLFCWGLIVAGPIAIALMLNRRQQQRMFQRAVEQLHGSVVSEKKDSVIVRIPYQDFDVSGAYFPGTAHWFGRDVLELHFALPPSEAQLYYCCSCHSGRHVPTGWTPLPPRKPSTRLGATTDHPDSQKLAGIGLDTTFDELLRSKPQQYCRAAIDGDTLILLVSGFGGYANTAVEIARVQAIGAQMARQIWMVMDGSVQVSATQSTPLEEQICPVCSSPVEDPVICERCRTPHCRDCWSFNGDTCGVFACGGHTLSRPS